MAVSEQSIEGVRGRGWSRILLRLVLFVVALGIGLGVIAGGLALLHERELGRILPGVSVAGIDVGGQTPDEARTTVGARLAALRTGGVVIRTSLGDTKIAFADAGRGADIDAMVADALATGRGGSWIDETVASIRLRMHPVDVPLRLTYDHDRAAALVGAFAARMELNAIDAQVLIGSSTFRVVPSVDGHRIDLAGAVAAVDAAMRDPATPAGSRLKVAIATVQPALTTEDADAARGAALKMATDIRVTAGSKTWTIKGTWIRRWIEFGWANGTFGPRIDPAKVPPVLKNIAKSVARPVRDAEFLRDKHGRIVGSMADRAGQALDVEKSVRAILDGLSARAQAPDPTPVKLAVKTIAPKVTAKDVTKTAPLMVKVGSWSTYYQVSAHNGFGANITIPARVLNGTVVQPGAVFDFWAGLGEVSLRTGYRMGGAIIGGHSVEGKALAGGICAASTTLFNAALRGGYDILARQPHWYYITRYPLGLDATVSGSQTMRFRNDTAYPILIRGFASPGVVRFEIWSVPNGRTVSLSRPRVSNVVPGSDSTVKTTALPAGTSERTEWPVDGKDVVVTRTVRDANGHVIHSDTFVSHYHRMVGILRIGIG
jgi:vancomycin resistance protein YoaR